MTLIEVLVALAILTTVVCGLSLFLYPTKWSQAARFRMDADTLLESEAWKMIAQNPDLGYRKNERLPSGKSLSVIVEPGGMGKTIRVELYQHKALESRFLVNLP